MFSAKKRLPRNQFPTPTTPGIRAHSAHFSVVAPHGAAGYAVVVSKKVARLAVTRHLIKRRVLATLRQAERLPGALVVYVKPGAATVSYPQLRDELYNLLPKIAE